MMGNTIGDVCGTRMRLEEEANTGIGEHLARTAAFLVELTGENFESMHPYIDSPGRRVLHLYQVVMQASGKRTFTGTSDSLLKVTLYLQGNLSPWGFHGPRIAQREVAFLYEGVYAWHELETLLGLWIRWRSNRHWLTSWSGLAILLHILDAVMAIAPDMRQLDWSGFIQKCCTESDPWQLQHHFWGGIQAQLDELEAKKSASQSLQEIQLALHFSLCPA